jgi:hypothetical protein
MQAESGQQELGKFARICTEPVIKSVEFRLKHILVTLVEQTNSMELSPS